VTAGLNEVLRKIFECGVNNMEWWSSAIEIEGLSIWHDIIKVYL
jgi:hypothetical protein